ncbi:ATP-binding protein [Roseibium aggregatum]|uniref:AAA family ATPase n=1 Tax=Roseibium aggregatum TaxID=187304 RepID=A0A939J207_9HYPH|nr:ATP-binding protein [Roseibium aggregatum]MBN9670918.1 AAA family ATPase [Roseibium aggregatum]
MKYDGSRRVPFKRLMDLVPTAPGWIVDWGGVWGLWPELAKLDTCLQDPVHHAEGDAGTHTRMVVEELVASPGWRALSRSDQSCLFWTAVLHDIGKPATTRYEEDGRITSRGHSRVGAAIARKLLWEVEAPFEWREQICGLISGHQLPFWLIEREECDRLAIKTSWKCRPDLLCLHAEADARGRICGDKNSILDNVALARQLFEDNKCLSESFAFANDESRVAFFERSDRDPYFAAHEDFRCNVIIMSGLPGSGKDTWIGNNRPDLPVVSLDAIRKELDEKGTGNQGRVVQAAYEMARGFLRERQDFVWNATNVTEQLRAKPIRLLRDYGARIEIVYLEPHPDRLLAQNRNRYQAVPETALANLLNKFEPPGDWEAHAVHRVVEGSGGD